MSNARLNLIERLFRELSEMRLSRGSFLSVPALIAAIEEYLSNHNQNRHVFLWSAPADTILSKVLK